MGTFEANIRVVGTPILHTWTPDPAKRLEFSLKLKDIANLRFPEGVRSNWDKLVVNHTDGRVEVDEIKQVINDEIGGYAMPHAVKLNSEIAADEAAPPYWYCLTQSGDLECYHTLRLYDDQDNVVQVHPDGKDPLRGLMAVLLTYVVRL